MSAGRVSAHGGKGPSRPAAEPSKSRPLATIAVFALLGPLVALLTLDIIIWIEGAWLKPVRHTWAGGPSGHGMQLHFLDPRFVPLAYALFGFPALVSGIGTVAADRWMRSPRLRYVVATMTSGAIVVGALLLIEEFERRSALVNARHYVRLLGPFTQLLLALVSALAALVCAWLTRRWRYNRA